MSARQAVILRHIGHNYWTRMRHSLRRADDYSGSLPADIAAKARHAQGVFDRYRTLGGIGSLEGARVLEIGPGDSLAVGLLFAAAGAERVVCLDKFRYRHDNTPFYEALRISPSLGGRVEARCGADVQDAGLEPRSFDWIVSNAVLEEIPDLPSALEAMERALRPGGTMLHQVDLSDYGMFSKHGFHPLEFLTVPEGAWRAMTDSSGGPNRLPLSFYRGKLESMGLSAEFLFTDDYVAGKRAKHDDQLPVPEAHWLNPVRDRLLPAYRGMCDAELAVYGVFVKAVKVAPST